MTIAFMPNDPIAGKPPLRIVRPRADRKPGQVGFTFDQLPDEQAYAVGTREFLLWQSREAALLTVEMWENLGFTIPGWQGKASKKRLRLLAVAGDDLNAYYDRKGLSFFESAVAGKTIFSGASTDILAHETGHALLDSIRPDLWDSMFFETNAFHEAFGDCVSVLVALYDKETRTALLSATQDLSKANFVEAFGEDLAGAVRKSLGAHHNAAMPRRSLNRFKWQFNDSLPDDGPGKVLINEIHSFGQIFSGCFYDLIAGVYNAGPKGEAALWTAAKAAGRLLGAGAAKAPHVPRFMQSVGRTMALEEEQLFAGRYRSVIREAFARHKVPLGGSAMLAPRAAIGDARSLRIGARTATLAKPTMTELKRHLHVEPSSRMDVRCLNIGGRAMAEARHYRSVNLTGMAEYLRGVSAQGSEPVLLERSADRAAILGAVPDSVATEDEVRKFVASLVRHNQIRQANVPAGGAGGVSLGASGKPTHEIALAGGRRVLRRVRFACGCAHVPGHPAGS